MGLENNNKKKVKVAEQDPPEEQAGPSRRKRVKAPTTPDEFFQEKHNMEDLWRAVFPVGTEWDQFDMVYQFNWNFSNLENAFEENGVLHGNKVYIFSFTEPQLVPVNGEYKVICIPVVVAIVSPFPPSDKIGINSVQREAEEILPMKKMKMDWVPYIPLAYSELDENAAGAFAQLVFSPFDESFAENVTLLPSGFCVIPLDPKTDDSAAAHTLDLASSLESGPSGGRLAAETTLNTTIA
ncbi:hypothetical protein IFM89_015304 [Coptis chinensis]|uniref:Uncharacterized protein n=1 Tax=Coptis chinensis TaxID=261450 RepID=A0A835IQM8_9MAGN|nr:hypothetical protein IFM89_015304 [Coptis chinensis]